MEVTEPVSFLLVNKRLKKGHYQNMQELVDDLHRIFTNAMSYNVEGSDIFEDAAELEALLIKTTAELGIKITVRILVFASIAAV